MEAVTRKLRKVAAREQKLKVEAMKLMREQLREDADMTAEDAEVAQRCLTEYIDALDFMCVMWTRLKDMTLTRDWTVHADLLLSNIAYLTFEEHSDGDEA